MSDRKGESAVVPGKPPSELVDRLRAGKAAANNLVPWWCSNGHELEIHPDCLAARCHCGRELRRKDLFPTWGAKRENTVDQGERP